MQDYNVQFMYKSNLCLFWCAKPSVNTAAAIVVISIFHKQFALSCSPQTILMHLLLRTVGACQTADQKITCDVMCISGLAVKWVGSVRFSALYMDVDACCKYSHVCRGGSGKNSSKH